MIFVALLKAVLEGIVAWLKLQPLIEIRKTRSEIRDYEDEILKLTINASPADILRIKQLEQRRQEDVEHLGAIRSAYSDSN